MGSNTAAAQSASGKRDLIPCSTVLPAFSACCEGVKALSNLERALHGFGFTIDDPEQHARRTLRFPPSHLPFLHRIRRQAETLGERFASEIELLPHRARIAIVGNMRHKAFRHFATRIGPRRARPL